jgi:peptidoglycan/LPS O-acetylase OafA/YrhL
MGVALFFVLSGFCIHYAGFSRRTFSARDFFWRRFLRLYPAYLVALIVFSCLEKWLPYRYFNVWQVVSHLLLIHNFTHATFFGINGSFWSLAVEAQFYLLYPLLLYANSKWGMTRSVVAALGLNLIAFLYLSVTKAAPVPVHPTWSFPLVTWCDWILGAALAEAYVQRRRLFSHEKSWLVGSGLLLLLVLNVRWLNVESYLFGAVFFAVALQRYLALKTPLHFVERALVPVGIISYSLYLWHEPLIYLVNQAGAQLGLAGTREGHWAWNLGVTTVAVGLIATASFWLFEVRVPSMIRSFVSKRRSESSPDSMAVSPATVNRPSAH